MIDISTIAYLLTVRPYHKDLTTLFPDFDSVLQVYSRNKYIDKV